MRISPSMAITGAGGWLVVDVRALKRRTMDRPGPPGGMTNPDQLNATIKRLLRRDQPFMHEIDGNPQPSIDRN